MKIKVMSLKLAIARAVYYFAIVAMLGLLGITMYKLIITPPCSVIGMHECIIDGWSVAGLAATILGVGATLLAILGAVAVAAWWTSLDRRVDERVNEQVEARLNRLMDEQRQMLRDQTEKQFSEQEGRFTETIADLHKAIKDLSDQGASTENILQDAKKVLTIGVMKQDPWVLESWASEVKLTIIGPEVTFWMTKRYLHIAENLLSGDVDAYKKCLEMNVAPSTFPKYYLDKATEWRNTVNAYPQVNTRGLDEEITKLRQQITAWEDLVNSPPSHS